jgi:vanillate O-demethylase ferredoxin subunit
MQMIAVRVNSKVQEAEDIATFELVPVDGTPLPAFTAGAHLDVHVSDALVRQYSLCNAPGEQHRYLIGVLRDANSRGGSVAMHEQIAAGDIVQISEPKNHFPLAPAKRSILFAGGIGVTPLMAMAETLSAAGADFALHYCSRGPERTAFVERIARSAYADKVHFHFDSGSADQKLDVDALLATPEADVHLYVCGPGGFIDHVVGAAEKHGWPASQIHREYFGAAAADTAGDQAFSVQIASTGQIIPIAADTSVYHALAACGVDVMVSCEQGVCGTCITRVLQGTPDHRDLYMTDEEHAANDQFTPCCSRSKTPLLVLDL